MDIPRAAAWGHYSRQTSTITMAGMRLPFPGRRGACFALCLALLFPELCFAQQAGIQATQDKHAFSESSSERASIPEAPRAEAPTTHSFWDKENLLLFSGVAIFRGLDYASTRNMQARGREEILLPDDVVNSSAGFASLEAAATMTSVGIAYIFHRTGHHKLERWLSICHIGVTGAGVARNYALKSKHPY